MKVELKNKLILLYKKAILHIKKQIDIYDLTIDNYLAIHDLLANGFTLYEALTYIRTNKNKNIIDTMMDKLEKGIPIENILFREQKMQQNFCFFVNEFDIKDALFHTIEFFEQEKKFKNKILSSLWYPLFVIMVATIVLSICNIWILPLIYNSLAFMEINKNIGLDIILKIINIILIIVIIGFMAFASILHFAPISKNMDNYMKIFKILKLEKLFNFYYSYYFCTYFNYLLTYDMSTNKQLQILSKMENNYILSKSSKFITEKLNDGFNMTEAFNQYAYFSNQLKQTIKIGIASSQLSKYLDKYLLEEDLKIKRIIKGLISSIQLFSYLIVGIVVLSISQVLFLPLDMLSNL